MSSTWIKCVVVLLLVVTQSLVFASLGDVENKTETLEDMITDCVKVPWMKAQNWLVHSSESARVEEVRAFIRGIESGEIWALQMLHTLLKVEKKSLGENTQKIGTDHQCIEIKSQDSDINIRNDSCPMFALDNIFANKGRGGGLCSSACHLPLNDEFEAAKHVAQRAPLLIDSNLEANSSTNAQIKDKNFTTVEISTIIFFSTIWAFLITCTVCDMVRRYSRSRNLSGTVNTLSKFSLYTNALALLSTKVSPYMMPAIHGIRSLGFCAVIIGHRYVMSALLLGHKITLLQFLEAKNSWLGVFMTMTPYTVDTFFVICGFFVTYPFFKSPDSRIQLNLPMKYLHRYFRITPCLVVFLLLAGVFSHRIGSGPLWEGMLNRSVNHCPESWWFYLLHVQNFVKDGFMCLPHSWYVAADMQLFWISPIILYSLYHLPKFGFGLLSLSLVAAVVTPATILSINGYSNAPIRLDMDESEQVESYGSYYITTYNRACPYLVGILLGYDVATRTRRLTKVNVAINWLVASSLILLSTWFTIRVSNSNFSYDLGMEIAFALLVRPSWSIATAWIVYACIQGHGGLLTRFLSLPLFIPLSRLAYCIYLVHPGVLAITIITSSQNPATCSIFEMLCILCVDLVASIAVAFVFSLMIESPVIVLIELLTNRGPQPEQSTTVHSSETEKEAIKSQ